MEFKKGQYIEVGMGDYDEATEEVEDGSSLYIYVDVESVDEDTIVDLFGKTENVLYVQEVTDEQLKGWAKENPPISHFLKP